MDGELLSAAAAARRLGISVTTLYDWLGQSDHGLLKVRGVPVTIEYLQTGPRGEGKISIESREIHRIRELLIVQPQSIAVRRPTRSTRSYPGITVPLGRPS